MDNQKMSVWKGSLTTASIVMSEIASRWGEKEAENYDPRKNCFTLPTWNKLGYRVKKGEKAIKSITFIKEFEDEDDDLSVEGKTYPKNVYLFYIKQVEKMKGGENYGHQR